MNSGGGGFNIDTGVADVFAKALFGDPEREMKLALQRSDLELDKYRQAQLESVVAHNNALTELERYKLQGRKGVVPALAHLFAGAGGGGGGDASTAPAPAPVETPIPVPTPRPRYGPEPEPPAPVNVGDLGWTPETPYQAIAPTTAGPTTFGQAPNRIQEAPVSATSDAGWTPETPFQTVAPVSVAGQEPDVGMSIIPPRAPVEPVVVDDLWRQIRENMPPGSTNYFAPELNLLGSVPPELRALDITRMNIPGRPTLSTYGDRPPPPSLEPVPVDIGGEMRDRPPPPSLMPVPITPETLTDRPPPPSLVPAFSGAPQAIGDRPPPVSPTYQPPAPPDPNAAIMPDATGADRPANAPTPPAQVLPGPQPNTVAVTNPKTGSTTVMSNDDYQALATYFAANATSAADLSAGVGKMTGQIGLEFGNTADQDVMRKAGILYTGGYPGEKDVLPGQPAKPADTSPFSGNDEKIQYQKILNSTAEKIRNRQPVTPDEAYAFAQSYTEMTKPSPELRSGPNGSVVSIMVPGIVAPGTPTVAEVFAAAGLPPPPAAAAAPTIIEGGGAAGAGGGAAGAAGTGAAAAGGGGTAAVPATQESPWGVKIVVPGSPEKMTENQNLAAQYYSVGAAVEPELRKLRAGNLPAAWKVYASDEDIMGAILNKGFAKVIKNKVMQGDTQLQGYLTNAKNFAAAILRRESGAAVGENELSQVFDRYIPQPGDTDETIAMKAAYRAVALEALRQGAIGEKPRSFEELDQRIQEVMRASNLDFAVPSSATQAQTKPRRRKLVDGKLVDVEG